MAKTSRYLGKMEHKNNELISKWFKKLHSLIAEKQSNSDREAAKFQFEQAVYGGSMGFVPRHYVFQGFK